MIKKLPMPMKKKPAMPGIEIEVEPVEGAEEEGGEPGVEEEMDLKSMLGEDGAGEEEGAEEDLSHLSDEVLMAEVRKRKLAMGGAAGAPASESGVPSREMPA